MALVIANSTLKGTRAGVVTLFGNMTGFGLLVASAVVGMAPLMTFAAQWFDVIKLVGALYLIWLGATYIYKSRLPQSDEELVAGKSGNLYMQAVIVALSNPKVLLFIGAFFPQFIDPGQPMVRQLIVLGVSFTLIVGVADLGIILMSGLARKWLLQRKRQTQAVNGILLVGAGLGLAFARR